MVSTGQTMLGHRTYQAIVEGIRDGIFVPGERLREEEVAARLGVSRTPVREAMGRLLEKGLLQAGPGRGLSIANLGVDQIFELYAFRAELEGLVARFAAQHATEAEISNLRRLNGLFEVAESAGEAARINREFHARLYDAARNRYLNAAVEDLHESIALLSQTTFSQPGRTEVAAREHKLILDLIAARDGVAAADAARAHISQALAVRLKMAEKTPSGI